MDRLWLLIDADDTLWENSVYFEDASEEFTEFLAHSALTPPEVRQVLDEIELSSLASQGYGSRSFARNLRRCFEHLAERHYCDEDLDRVTAIGEAILHRPIEVIEGVADTLAYLNARHHLTLFTKGHSEEQLLKFNRSALGDHFHGVKVVGEKDAGAYREIVETEAMDPEHTWMIGNSPKSDIHPALEAGLGAVLVPHERTWRLELTDIPPESGRFRIVQRFSELRRLF
jgi:putative hydrolase of the HAD superfamily